MNLPYRKFISYWRAISNIQAEEMLCGYEVSVAPHVKVQDRKKIISRLKKAAYNFEQADGNTITTAELAAQLAQRGDNG